MTGEQVGGSEGKGVIMCHRERHMMSCNPSITCTVQDSNQRREPVCLESTVLMTRQEKKTRFFLVRLLQGDEERSSVTSD